MTQKETTSGRKLSKLARRIYKRDVKKFYGNALKPKPKWVPWVVWGWLLGLVLHIEEKQYDK